MPQIPEYNAPNATRGFQPSEIGVDATAQAARRIGSLAQEGGNAIKEGIDTFANSAAQVAEEHYGRQEVLQVGAQEADARSQLTDSWNAFRQNADPNDPTTADKWLEQQAKPMLEDRFGGASISKAGERARIEVQNGLLNHFGEKTKADMNIVAKEAATNNLVTMGNKNSAAIVNDPSAFEDVNRSIGDTFNRYLANNPNLSAEDTAGIRRMEQQFYKTNSIAAIHGTVSQDLEGVGPDKAESDIASGRYSQYLDAKDLVQMKQYIQMQRNQGEHQKIARQNEADKLEHKGAEEDASAMMKTIASAPGAAPGPGWFNSLNQFITKHPNDIALSRELMISGNQALEDSISGKFTQSDPNVMQSFRERMYSADPTKIPSLFEITRAANERQISRYDAAALHQENQEITANTQMKSSIKRVDDLAKGYASLIVNPMQTEAEKQSKLRPFYDEVHQMALDKSRDGTINQLFPENGGDKILQAMAQQPKYKMSTQDVINQRLAAIRGTNVAQPQTEQEQIADFVRKGGKLEDFKFDEGASKPAAKPGKSIEDFTKDFFGQNKQAP